MGRCAGSAAIFIVSRNWCAWVTSFLFLAAAYAAAEPAPYRLGSISLNPAFAGLIKRQAGYQPSQTYCSGTGDCASACGAGYVTCASNDGDLHCYNPGIQETCCPNLSGNSCSEGYYCTQDASDNTWCCPNGMNLAECAAAYSLTASLESLAPSTIAAASSTTTSLPPYPATSSPPSYPTTSSPFSLPTTTSYPSGGGTGTTYYSHSPTSTTAPLGTGTAPPTQFSGVAAKKDVVGALNVLGVVAAGVMLGF